MKEDNLNLLLCFRFIIEVAQELRSHLVVHMATNNHMAEIITQVDTYMIAKGELT